MVLYTMSGYNEKTSMNQEVGPQDPKSVGALILDFQPPELWEINVCHLGYSDYGSLLSSPSRHKTKVTDKERLREAGIWPHEHLQGSHLPAGSHEGHEERSLSTDSDRAAAQGLNLPTSAYRSRCCDLTVASGLWCQSDGNLCFLSFYTNVSRNMSIPLIYQKGQHLALVSFSIYICVYVFN